MQSKSIKEHALRMKRFKKRATEGPKKLFFQKYYFAADDPPK